MSESIFNTNVASKNAIKKLDHELKQQLRSVIMQNSKNYGKLQQAIPRKKKATIFDILFRFTTNTYTSRPAMKGVFFDKEHGKLVSTNGYVLAVFDEPLKIEKTMIQDKYGSEITGIFPSYQNIIPKNYNKKYETDIKECLSRIIPIECVSASLFSDFPAPCINVVGIRMSVSVLRDIFQSFFDMGDTEITIEVNSEHSPVKFTGSMGFSIYAMGCLGRLDNCVWKVPVSEVQK